jgi:hypothetical protein
MTSAYNPDYSPVICYTHLCFLLRHYCIPSILVIILTYYTIGIIITVFILVIMVIFTYYTSLRLQIPSIVYYWYVTH